MSTVPMFAPDGTLGDIPYERMMDARKAGFTPGVTMQTADGQTGVIPAPRVQEAAKSGMQIVPLKDQDVQHPGFWASLGQDLKGMLPNFQGPQENLPNPKIAGYLQSEKDKAQEAAEDASRKAAGYSMPYRALAPVAESLGVNVPGMEESAKEGDQGGVLGHAAAVPTVMAATEGMARSMPLIRNAATSEAATKAWQTAKVAAKTGSKFADVASFERLGKMYDALTSAKSQLQDIWGTKEITLPDLTDKLAETIAADRERQLMIKSRGLGELPATGARPASETGEALANEPTPNPEPKGGKLAAAPRFSQSDRAAASSLLQDVLRKSTDDVIDAAIPKDAHGPSLQTKATVNFYLKRGDVGKAEAALDAGAKQANPSWVPMQRQVVPSTNDIRARVQAASKLPSAGSAADIQDTRALQQEMNWDLQKHGIAAEEEARREFIARNSTGVTKGELGAAAQRALGKNVSAPDDLTDLLQRSLDALQNKQQAK